MALEATKVDVSVVLGKTQMPLSRFLRLGRGALLLLDTSTDDVADVLANGHLVARGMVAVNDERVGVEITEVARRPDVVRTSGTRIAEVCGLADFLPAIGVRDEPAETAPDA